MSHADFVHLRLHTSYSLLEGAIRIPDLVHECLKMNMPAVAMTDTCNLFGAMEFASSCSDSGIQPIIGCQLDLVPFSEEKTYGRSRNDFSQDIADKIVLLVQSEVGYQNLLQLVSMLHLESESQSSNQISLETLKSHSDGVIALTGGCQGGIGKLISQGKNSEAKNLLIELAEVFDGRLYVELMRHGLRGEKEIENELVELAYQQELPLVATNECFFIPKDMFDAHDALTCISNGTYVDVSDRPKLTPEHYLKPPEEMIELFSDLPEATSNTLIIAQRCAFMPESRDPLLPPAPLIGKKQDSDNTVLKNLARDGLETRMSHTVLKSIEDGTKSAETRELYTKRLEHELGIIFEMDFSGYFLIVADFVQWAKSNNIPVGPGRGSGAGSLVAWALTITDLDPIKFGLLFERFLNPERVSMPDFDVDFCQEKRDEVIRYVQSKYGADRVAQIITFGSLQARAALRDVGRVLQMPYSHVDRICKLVPNNPANPVTLKEAIDNEPQLQVEIEEDSQVAQLAEISMKLEGLYRHASTHAAGVVIGDRPLVQLVPLYRDPRSEMPVTQFAMKWSEMAGLVKFDFLGLKTLTVISTTQELLSKRGIAFDINNVNISDAKTFEMLARGETTGVFQLESSGMRDILRNLKPDTFEDIIAIVALFRPGPMDNIPSYIRRKHGKEKPDYLHPKLENILRETYGIMIYQEQVMQIAQELAGYTLANADLLRRAMGKKIQSEMDAQSVTFITESVKRGVAEDKANEIFEQVSKFAGYGFNKSHAAAYALVAYQTAYLKANYPTEFMAASMTLDINNTDKLHKFKQELDRMQVSLLPPDINHSFPSFAVEQVGAEDGSGLGVRYALAAIKNVGLAAMKSITQERTKNGVYMDIADFSSRLDSKTINKRQLEYLSKAGVFDSLVENRKMVFQGVAEILKQAVDLDGEKHKQIGLFESGTDLSNPLKFEDVSDWEPIDRLKEEFGAVGFYLSAHPLDAYDDTLQSLGVKTINDIQMSKLSGTITLAGVVMGKSERVSQRGNKYAFIQLSDRSGVYEAIAFSELLAKHPGKLESGELVLINASVQFVDESLRITIQGLQNIRNLNNLKESVLKVFIDGSESIKHLRDLLEPKLGGDTVVILVPNVDKLYEVEIKLPSKYNVSNLFASNVKRLPGISAVTQV